MKNHRGNGLNQDIQREMWRFELSPTVLSWEEVEAAAIRFELSAKAAKHRPGHGGGGNGNNGGEGHGGNGGGSGGGK